MTVHDVVVVGGGIAGTMAVLAARERGLDVGWIADEIGPDAQSARWHAHLHRGRLYDPVREAGLIAELKMNSTFWWSEAVEPFHAGLPTVAIGPDRSWAADFRTVLEGQRGEEVVPPYLRRDAIAVRTDEAILDGPRFITTARMIAESRATTVHGRCTSIRRDAAAWSARVRVGDGEREVRGASLVLATGADVAGLLPDGVELDHTPDTRLSRMLVLRGDLPRAAAIVPSRASGGLFFASRELQDGSDERIWLVSDGFNSPGRRSPGALTDAWWACSVVERLTAIIRSSVLDRVVASAYVAPKSRLTASPTQVPARGISVDREARLVVLTPSKGSASPGAAIDALDALHPDPVSATQRLEALGAVFADPPRADPVFAEQWESVEASVPLHLLRTPGIDALDAAASMFSASGSRVVRRVDGMAVLGG